MSDPAIPQQPLKPDNDADGNPRLSLVAGQAGQRQPQPQPSGPEPEGGKGVDAGWLDTARREGAHIEYECLIHSEAQFEACARWGRWNTALGFLSAVLGALTASTIATVLGEAGMVPAAQAIGEEAVRRSGEFPMDLKPWMALGALVAGVVAAAVRFLDPQGRATQHGAAGKRYRALADEARQFRNLEATAGAARDGLLNHLQTMVRHRAEIHEAAPVIPKRAYVATRNKAGDDPRLQELAGEAGRPRG